MGTIRKKGLAVCMIALMAVLGMTVSAERQSETGNEENIETVSGGDVAGEQVMPYAADIASGMNGGIMWTIDASGKLTVTGRGDLPKDNFDTLVEAIPWYSHRLDITSAVISVNGMTDASELFYGCSFMTNIDISGWDTSSVENMGSMFQGCSSLTTLDVSQLKTNNVTSMIGMFNGCSSLTSLDVSQFDTSNVVTMSAMFYGCASLTDLNLSNFDTKKVVDMSLMFVECGRLKSLDISNFDLNSVDDMSGMFLRCNSLTTLRTPSNVNRTVSLPVVAGTTWSLPDGTEITELPQGVSTSVTLTRSGTPEAPGIITTTPDLNMSDVIRVKYVPYSYTVETNNIDPYNTIEFSIVEGRLADGLQMYPATGEIYGVPTEAGEFKITVMAVYSNPAYLPSYAELTLTVLDNTDGNVGVATDPGYNITQPVTGFNVENIAGNGTQTLVSQGEYSQFRDVYIDGKKLTAGQDYTSEAGSTRITIMNQTLADGGTGTHTLGIEFRTETGSLKRAAQNYVISNNTNAGNNTGNNGNSNNSNNNNNNNGNSGNGNNSNNILPVSTELPLQDFVIYTVKRGDSLWDIAVKFYGKGESWRKIYQDNAAVIKNPSRLYAGQKLVIRLTVAAAASPVPETTIPATDGVTAEGTTYRVQKGDMLWSIAQKAYGDGKLWKIIYEANKGIIKNPGIIREGQVLNIPQR